MKAFQVGREYEPYQREYGPIKVTRRTEKTIWVDNGQAQWRMRVKRDVSGNEYAVDSTVPKKWRDAFTYEAGSEKA